MQILIVDDIKSTREEIRNILHMEDYEVFEAKDGYDALKKAEKILPDLILSDIMMPALNGFQLFNELKKSPHTKNIPFIFLSGRGDKIDEYDKMNPAPFEFLTKPISADDLVIAIFYALRHNSTIKQKLLNYGIEITNNISDN